MTSKHPKRRAAGIRMAANMLGRISQKRGLPSGQRVQLVEFGPRSKRRGYSVYVPGHVSERAYVRKFRFGGAAKRAHERALQSGYSKKRYSKRVSANGRRRTSMRRNSKKRHSVRRNSKRRGSRRRGSRRVTSNRYVVVNGRRKRRMRRNMTIMGIDPITQVLMPGGYAVGGLILANGLANAVANVEGVRNVLDAGHPAESAVWTKSLVGALAAGGLLAFSGKLPSMLRQNITPIVAGMGCAVAVRLLRGQASIAPYLGRYGVGEYVSQPMGAYVTDPSMGEYVSQPMGEYVESGMSGLGTAYAMAGDNTDRQMDVMEAAAGVGAYEAAAGMGVMYAAAGMGNDTGEPKLPQPPFISTEQPIDMAANVTGQMPRTLPVPAADYAREDSGRRRGRGIFSGSLFDGML